MKQPILFLLLLIALIGITTLVSCQEEATATVDASPEATDEDLGTTMDLDADEATGDVTQDYAAEAESTTETVSESAQDETSEATPEEPVQIGPFIDLLGPQLLSLTLLDEQRAQLEGHYTNEILTGKKVVGLYFSADWCGPCRQFTPELVSFYERMNKRRGKKDQFEIVWISRCRDTNSYVQYFASMPWIALPPEEAMGQRGQWLGEKYKVKSIPTLVLLDDLGNTITIDGRNKIPQDKAGIGFPWRSPVAQICSVLFPRSLRLMVKNQIDSVKGRFVVKLKNLIGLGAKKSAAAA